MTWWHFILIWYAAASSITFAAYALDKRWARRGGRRIAERTLHLLALLGGWPGAHLARAFLRHKTRKVGFALTLWLITILHACALIAGLLAQ